MTPLQDAFQYAAQQVRTGNLGSAEQVYCRIIAEHEDDPTAHLALGTVYALSQAPGRAITFLKRGLLLSPNHPGGLANLAAVYRTLGMIDKSYELNRKALEVQPNDPKTLSNISGLFINAREPGKALYWADKALAVAEIPEARNHRAIALLEMGKFPQGWAEYDARLDIPGFHRRPYVCPMWDGKPVKNLAIHGEQGLGDEIMFLTFMKQIEGLYEEVALEVSPRLVKLMQHSFPRAKVFGSHDELIAWFKPDAHIAMGSLPRLFWPVKPNVYLKPTHLQSAKRRIGISWFGGTRLTHLELRNTVVTDWKAFLDLDAEFISLQYGPAGEESQQLGIPHDAQAIADLDALASLIKSCDLVISVCNTTIHMAGALGVPCLVLTPYAPAWRYGLSGEKMVWYDSPALIRQDKGELWPSVIQRAKDRCADYGFVQRTEPAIA